MWRRIEASRVELLPIRAEFREGLDVDVTIPERLVLLGAVVAHGLPLAALLTGAALGALVGGTDTQVLIGAVVGIVAGLSIAPMLRSRVERAALAAIEVRPAA
jgi:positive regulator of sigma E activity